MANFNSLVESSELILVDFHAEWCGPCKMMPPILSDVKNQMGGDVKIVKIDIDKKRITCPKPSCNKCPNTNGV